MNLRSLLFLALPGIVCQAELFSTTCENRPDQLSAWSKCVIPNGNLGDAITSFLRDVKEHGCKLPPKKAIRFGLSFLRNHTSYLDHPLYKRIPAENCGNCGRRVRCCKLAKSFLSQSYQSEMCPGYSHACAVEPLTQKDIDELTSYYPQTQFVEAVPPKDGCDVSGYVKAELKILSSGPAFRYVEPLLCQVIGTKLPSVNCIRHGNKCYCCCIAHTPTKDGTCVPAKSIDSELTCKKN
ncbi:unnamed protein product [Enterobius vermicularis]|uniref:Uncharacterized protein n=1 Tax=Enterobius vermicularis TaxID=51028 RepID=A0A0N4V7Q4_ENTVE|nr:unnamed protein product [Enterobius vermicularis]